MLFVLKGYIESRQLQSISAKFSDWGSVYMLRNLLNLYLHLTFVKLKFVKLILINLNSNLYLQQGTKTDQVKHSSKGWVFIVWSKHGYVF